MRLTINNIAFVKELTCDGLTYEWFVSMKSGRASDSILYVNYENNKTVVKEFAKDRLPVSVQKFIDKHERKEFSANTWKDQEYIHYIYK